LFIKLEIWSNSIEQDREDDTEWIKDKASTDCKECEWVHKEVVNE